MAVAAVGGAALLAAFVKGFANFHAKVKGVASKLPRENVFIFTLARLKHMLDRMAPMIKDVIQLDCPEKKTRDLIRKMNRGKQLVQLMNWNKCSMARNISRLSQIDNLLSQIVEFCLFDLQILQTIGEQMWKMEQTHCPQFKIEGATPGAAFVKGFADFHATVKGAVSKLPRWNRLIVTLGGLESTLDRLAPMIKDVKQLDCPEKKTWDLIKKIKMGEQLVQFLSWNKYCNIDYRSKIDNLVSNIIEFCLFDLQILQTIEEPMWKMVQTHCPQFEIEAHKKSIFPVIANQVPRHLEAAVLSPSTSILHLSEIVVSLPRNSQWQRGKFIGCGSFASVYIATNRNTPALCAIKEVKICPDVKIPADTIKRLWQEIKLLRELKHPNIVQYYDSEIVDSWFRIYMEYVPGGSIEKYINDKGAIPESVIRRFITHILSGLHYLHSKNIVHRDIKGANLLIDSYGVVRLADFGTAKHLAEHADADAAKLYAIGTVQWMAPELVRCLKSSSSNATLAADIWSVGCTVIQMYTGRRPWGALERQAVIWKLGQGNSPPIPETLSSKVKNFLQCCFQIDPVDRPSAAQLLEHPFLKNQEHLDVPCN